MTNMIISGGGRGDFLFVFITSHKQNKLTETGLKHKYNAITHSPTLTQTCLNSQEKHTLNAFGYKHQACHITFTTGT